MPSFLILLNIREVLDLIRRKQLTQIKRYQIRICVISIISAKKKQLRSAAGNTNDIAHLSGSPEI